MPHTRKHSLTGTTDHDLGGLISGQLLNIDASGSTISSSGVYALSGTVTADTFYSGTTPLQTILNNIAGGTGFSGWTNGSGNNSIIANNGSLNIASSNYTFVAGFANSALTQYSSVLGGIANLASGDSSIIGGGYTNLASGNASFIGAGESNLASGFQTFIGAGYKNSASTTYSSVVGGKQNWAFGVYSFIANGSGNTASGQASSILGGSGNTISGRNSVVVGGANINGSANDTMYAPNARLAETVGSVIYSAGTDLYNIFSAGGGGTQKYTLSTGLTASVPMYIDHNLVLSAPSDALVQLWSGNSLTLGADISAVTVNQVVVTVASTGTYNIVIIG